MNFSSEIKNKLFDNKINLNNRMIKLIKEKNQKENIKNLQINLLNKNQPISLKKIPLKNNYFNNNRNGKRINETNDLNIVNNTYKNNLNSLNYMRNQINPPDERLIYCIKMLGLKKFYWNFFHKNLNFEDFLAITNEDMNKMRIPEKVQNIIQNFIMNYLNFGSHYSLEELIYYKKKKKLKNNFEIKKRIQNNNYIQKQDKISSINNKNRYNNKLNNKKYSKSVTPTKKNCLFRKKKQNKYNNEYNDFDEEININKINNSNYNGKQFDYDINIMSNNNLTFENINRTNFHNEHIENNYLNKNQKKYRSHDNLDSEDEYKENNYVKNKRIRNQSANYFQNNLNDFNILNLKNSYQNLYANKFNQNNFNINNDESNSNFKKIKCFENKKSNNISQKPIISGLDKGMIMNNLNNYFIYNNYRTEEYRENDRGKKIINKKQINNIIKQNKNDYYSKNLNRENKNLNIKKSKNNSKEIINYEHNINNKHIMYNTMLDYDESNDKFLNMGKNVSQINMNKIDEKQINHFRSNKNHNLQNYYKNLNNNININNNKAYTSRNTNNNQLNNFINYTQINDTYSLNPNLKNLYINTNRDKDIRQNYTNQLPIKTISNMNFMDIQNNQFNKKTKAINLKKNQFNNFRNNQNNKYLKSNFQSTPNLQNNTMKIANRRKKLELLKKEINELYNKMQMINFIEDSNKEIHQKNINHQKDNMKNKFSKSANNFFDINDL